MGAKFLGSFVSTQQLPVLRQPKIAFLGRSNVGKSSLINLISGSTPARVSKTPGRTRTLNLYEVDEKWIFGDFPGYGYARVSQKERRQFENLISSFLRASYFDLAVLIVDSRHPGLEMDLQLQEWLNREGLPQIVVLSKSDKLNQKERSQAKRNAEVFFPEKPVLFASAYTKEGKHELLRLFRV